MSTRHIQDRHDGYAISKHGPGSNRTYGCCLSSEVELLTATDTATPTGRKRDATDLENTQSPPKKKKVVEADMSDMFSTPPKEAITEPTSPALQHATKLARRGDDPQPADESSLDLMSWSADELIKFFLERAVTAAPRPSAASGSGDHDTITTPSREDTLRYSTSSRTTS